MELLAVIAVVSILLAMLVPSVTAARQAAYRVVSAANQRTLGQGIIMWAGGKDSELPHSRVFEENPLDLAELMRVFEPEVEADDDVRPGGYQQDMMTPGDRYMAHLNAGEIDFGWDGLGHLYRGYFVSDPAVFYSPAHSGDHPFEELEDLWVHPDTRQVPDSTIYANYHYVGHLDEDGRDIKLHDDSERILIVDGLRTRMDLNGRDGINVLWVDNSVHWRSCPGLFHHLDPTPRGADEPPKGKQNDIIRSVFNGTLLEQLKKYELDPNS